MSSFNLGFRVTCWRFAHSICMTWGPWSQQHPMGLQDLAPKELFIFWLASPTAVLSFHRFIFLCGAQLTVYVYILSMHLCLCVAAVSPVDLSTGHVQWRSHGVGPCPLVLTAGPVFWSKMAGTSAPVGRWGMGTAEVFLGPTVTSVILG